jgi:replicative DNA helicase/5S rRNA maturation endonuclease (ribonuclease M5)
VTRTEEFVRRMGWEYKKVEGHNGLQLNVKVCPYCYDDKGTHFYILDGYNGAFICHKCGASGSLDDLMEQVKEIQPVRNPFKEHEVTSNPDEASRVYMKAHKDLLTNPRYSDLLIWLVQERKIKLSVIKQMRIGARDNYGKQWICFPYWTPDRRVVCAKERTIEKDFVHLYFTENKGGPLYNQGAIEGKSTVIITEGELDTLSLLSIGISTVASVSNGSSYINSAWLPVLKDAKKIYLAYDGDDKGRAGATNFAKQLGLERCYMVPFDEETKDANAYLIRCDPDYRDGDSINQLRSDFVERFLKPAKPIDIEGVISVSNALEQLLNQSSELEISELDTPWECVNRLLDRRGFSGGDLVVVTANPGIGKTTWALNIIHHLTKKGIPSLFFELEFSPQRLAKKLVCLDQKVEQVKVEHLLKAHSDLGNLPLYLGFRATSLDLDKAVETIRAAYNRYTLQFVVFDHLHFLIRARTNETQEISIATQTFKSLAIELNIPILLICHLSKIPRERSARRAFEPPDAEYLRGSKMIWADADYVVLLHRERLLEADAQNKLNNFYYTLKRKNPGLISQEDLIRHAEEGRLTSLKGVKDTRAREIEDAISASQGTDELNDVYDSTTKVILQKNRYGPGGVRILQYNGAQSAFTEER